MLAPLRSRRRQDQGQGLVLVVVLAFVLVLALAAAAQVTIGGLGMSGEYQATERAALASQTGVAAGLSAMRSVTVASGFPCALSGSTSLGGASSSYTVSVTYFTGTTALACTGPGSTLGGGATPTAATLTSTGRAPFGAPVVQKADVAIGTTVVYAPPISYAIFSEQTVSLSNGASVASTPGNTPAVYAGGTVTCPNAVVVQGPLTAQQPLALSNGCRVTGDVVSTGAVSLGNGVQVGGSVTSYSGGITMTGSASVAGSVTAVNGSISLSNSAKVAGAADASGSISVSGTASIGGAQTALDAALSLRSPPPPLAWIQIAPSVADWVAAGWNVVQVPGGGYTCATFFANNGSLDPFMFALQSAAQKTVVYAPTCAVTYSHGNVFKLGADVAVQIQTLTLTNANTFESTTSTPHDLSLLASAGTPCSPNVDITLSNQTSFLPPTVGANPGGLAVLVYTPGATSYGNAPSMTGQILSCGGVTGTNAFSLLYSPVAAEGLPGTAIASPPTVSVQDRYAA